MTLGRVILLRRDHAGDEALLAHELVHVRQWRELGPVRFLAVTSVPTPTGPKPPATRAYEGDPAGIEAGRVGRAVPLVPGPGEARLFRKSMAPSTAGITSVHLASSLTAPAPSFALPGDRARRCCPAAARAPGPCPAADDRTRRCQGAPAAPRLSPHCLRSGEEPIAFGAVVVILGLSAGWFWFRAGSRVGHGGRGGVTPPVPVETPGPPPAPAASPLAVHVAGRSHGGFTTCRPVRRWPARSHAAAEGSAANDLDRLDLAARLVDGQRVAVARRGEPAPADLRGSGGRLRRGVADRFGRPDRPEYGRPGGPRLTSGHRARHRQAILEELAWQGVPSRPVTSCGSRVSAKPLARLRPVRV